MANTIQGVYFVFLPLCYQVLFICSSGRIIHDEDVYILYSLLCIRYKIGALSLVCSLFPLFRFVLSPFCVTTMLCIFAAVWFEQHIKPSGVLITYIR